MRAQLRTETAETSTAVRLLAVAGILAPVAFMVSALAA
jgi:hypothetical protein